MLGQHGRQREHKEHKRRQLGHDSMRELNKPKEQHSMHCSERHLPSFLDDPKHRPNVHHNELHPSCYSVKRKLMEQHDDSMRVKQLVRLDQSIRLKRMR